MVVKGSSKIVHEQKSFISIIKEYMEDEWKKTKLPKIL